MELQLNITYSPCTEDTITTPNILCSPCPPITFCDLNDFNANFEDNNTVNNNDILSILLSMHHNLINNKLICDQNDSRYLHEMQQLINYCINIYGKYIIQLLFIEHTLLLDSFIYGNILKLSKSIYGCFAIQKCLLFDENTIINSFEKQNITALQECLLCPYVNHDIQLIFNLQLHCKSIQFIKLDLEKNYYFIVNIELVVELYIH